MRFEGECNTSDAVSVQVVVNQGTLPVIEGDMAVCVPSDADYSVTGLEGSLFSWSVTGGTIVGDATGITVTVQWIDEGPGTVGVTETTTGGCVGTADSTVVKYRSPVADEILGGGDVACSGDMGTSYYIDGLVNSTFQWTVEEGTIGADFGDSIVVDWTVPQGDYLVTVIEVSEYGCAGEPITRTIQVEAPDIDLGGDTYVCEGDSYTIDLAGEYATYLWHDGSTGSGFSTDAEGWIGVQVEDEFGCTAADSLYLSIQTLPVVELGNDTSLCGDLGLVLNAGPDGTIYDWSTGESGQEITVFQGARKEISVVVEDEYGCISMDTIVVDECDVEFYFMDIPTAITPNDDGTNDVWNITKLTGYTQAEVEIFSRWGTLVWKSEPGYSVPWDGMDMNGNKVPMDSYHFVIKLNVGSVDRITGIITVIR